MPPVGRFERFFSILLGLSVVVFLYVYLRTKSKVSMSNLTFDKAKLLDIKQQLSLLDDNDDSSTRSRGSGRSSDDGRWFSMLKPYELYTYTAFYDNRATLGARHYVRVISVMEMTENVKVHCGLWYQNDDEDAQPDIREAELLKIGFGVFRHDKYFLEQIISCEVPRNKVPVAVAVIPSTSSRMSIIMPVESPARKSPEHDFIVCVSVSYWKHDPYRLVEWVEMQRILGAKSVNIYNNSLSREASEVFLHYSRQGFVKFRQSHNFIPDLGELTIHLHMSPVLNDCLYRNMFSANKVVIVDLDEVILPHAHDNWSEMIADMEARLPEEFYNPHRSYVFKNSYFFLDLPPDEEEPEQTTFLRYRRRMPTVSEDISIKSIVDARVCVQLHNHACWTRTRARDISQEVDVDPSYGMNHHYKYCHFDRFEGVVGKCRSMYSDALRDDIMLNFRQRLLENVDAQLKKLHLKPIFD